MTVTRKAAFVQQLTEREARLGKILAEQLHRAMVTEDKARQAADAEAESRTDAYWQDEPMSKDREIYNHLIACETRTQQARYELNRHCQAIGKRLDIAHFALISDHFRAIAGPVEPIQLTPRHTVNPIAPHKRRNRFCQEHDDRIAHSDILYLMQRDGLSYSEAVAAYPEKLAAWPKPAAPPPAAYLPAAYLPEQKPRQTIAPPSLTTPEREKGPFVHYEWTFYPPGGIAERALERLANSAPYRREITAAKREQDIERQKANVRNATVEIAAAKVALSAAKSEDEAKLHELLLSAAIRKFNLAQAWLAKPASEREPFGRYNGPVSGPGPRIRAEAESRARAKQIKAFLDTGERLNRAPTVHMAMARMQDATYCGSPAHRLQVENSGCVWNYDPEHSTKQPTNPALFEIRFRQHLADYYRIPVYAATVWGSSFEIVHARYFDRLHVSDFELIAQIGQHVADKHEIAVQWGGIPSPAQWEVEDETA